MARCALVTLADTNYIEQAKQLFGAVCVNAGWRDDLVLLTHKIPEQELEWFIKRGIIVQRCQSLITNQPIDSWSDTVLSKLHLFTNFFKQWEHIIYVDADMLIRASLEDLKKVDGFHAVTWGKPLRGMISDTIGAAQRPLFDSLVGQYDLTKPRFFAGVMAFPSDIITSDLFNQLVLAAKKYAAINKVADELPLNLYFLNRWQPLPRAFFTSFYQLVYHYRIAPRKVDGIIIHPYRQCLPWKRGNFFYHKWRANRRAAEKIKVHSARAPQRVWSPKMISSFEHWLQTSRQQYQEPATLLTFWQIVQRPRVVIGLIGRQLKRYLPPVYHFLKRFV